MTRAPNAPDHDALRVYLEELAAVTPLSREDEQRLFLLLGEVEQGLRQAVLEAEGGIELVLGWQRELVQGRLRAADLSIRANAEDFDESAERARMTELLGELGRVRETVPGSDARRQEVQALVSALGLSRQAVLRLAHAFLQRPPSALNADGERVKIVTAFVARAEQVKTELIAANLRLVLRVAKRHLGRGVPLLDLIQEGNLGLLKAIEGFEPERGHRLSTYAVWWIRQSMRQALAEQGHTIRVPRHLLETLGSVQRFARKFSGKHGRQPTAHETSQSLGLPLHAVERALEAIRDTVSYDAPLTHDGHLDLDDVLPDEKAGDPGEFLLDKDFMRQAQQALLGLDQDERRVLELRFGLGGIHEHTVEEAADRLGCTRERLRELETRAIRKLQRTRTARILRVYARG
jgi:RNA polymerase sigma factor (sigma-70 family)